MLGEATSTSPREPLIFERCTSQNALDTFFSWPLQEQWNPSTKGNETREVFLKADPNGFICGKIINPETRREEIISIVSAITYGNDQAWVGFYIVNPRFRGHGYGLESFRKALEHAGHDRASVGLDGVMAQVENYKKSGFTAVAWQNGRRHGSIRDLIENQERDLADRIARDEVPGLVLLTDPKVDKKELAVIEQRYAGLKRPQFVQDWADFHALHPEEHRFGVAVLATDDNNGLENAEKPAKGTMLGWACVRPAETSYRVGPLYADTPEVAKQLLVKLAYEVLQAEKQSPYHVPLKFDVDVPNSNQAAVELFDRIGWNDTFPSLRMWKGKMPEHDVNGVFGVASLEVG
ncbi:hypothetical protein BGZ99_009694 [Dissophora globulifera]|uniref:N-acetyltransferase domain-containing protein n=1 Tax=Dissophora globulifera TaxID=979702 RepID=A0A9P6RV33_9FUNG|nr:hypothetical protein BGZ99_009694 [Dissophora globulifera]